MSTGTVSCSITRTLVWPEGGSPAVEARVRDEPPTDFLPLAMRKRLSPLTKLALWTAHHALLPEERSTMRTVFATRHGESHTTLELLSAVYRNEMPSPFAFSRSVHNTGSGLASLALKNKTPSTALAAGEDTFIAGLLEAVLTAAEGEPVLFVMADQLLAEPFGRRMNEEARWQYAAGLVIAPGTDLEITFEPRGEPGVAHALPQAIRFLDEYRSDRPEFVLAGRSQSLRFRRASGARASA